MSNFLNKRPDCPICKSTNLKKDFQIRYWRENLLDYSDCEDCGATFANPMPNDSLISQGNSALVRYYQLGRTEEQEFRDARQAYLKGKFFAKKLMRWKRGGRLLELGCYQGFFSLGIKEHSDWEVAGLEISAELCGFVQKNLGIECFLGTLEKANVPKHHFDFIVCHDLIEHINDPQTFLQQLKDILAPSGRIEITTPNGKQDLAYTRRCYQQGIVSSMLLNHILYFRHKSLKIALEKAGLSFVKSYCYDLRNVVKDFGYFGFGKPVPTQEIPSMQETLQRNQRSFLNMWTPQKIDEMRSHFKVSTPYGWIKKTLPELFSLHLPTSWEIGHEIYLLAEKRGIE